MSVLHAEVLEAFRPIDVPEDKAIRAATALTSSPIEVEDATDKGFSKRDADIEAIRRDVGAIKLDIVGIEGEVATMKWMGGIILAMLTTVLFRVFSH